MREKREHQRAEYEVDVTITGELNAVMRSRDISLGGVFLLGGPEEPPKIGGAVILRMELPGVGLTELPGFVRWTNPGGVGVQFGLIGAQATHAIGKLVRAQRSVL